MDVVVSSFHLVFRDRVPSECSIRPLPGGLQGRPDIGYGGYLAPLRHRYDGRMRTKSKSFFHEHSLSIVAAAILLVWIVLAARTDPDSHAGAFFGNAAADWMGVVLMMIGTKFLYERGSKESKPVRGHGRRLRRLFVEHSLTIVLVLTGLGWLFLYASLDPKSRWGEIVGNVLSEWCQVIGLVLLTKKLLERGSEESK